MTEQIPGHALQMRSRISSAGVLELSLDETEIGEPASDEVVVRMEAAPIHPTDMALMFGLADMSQAQARGTSERPVLTAPVPAAVMPVTSLRLDRSLPVGIEGAGTVMRAGDGARHLQGRMVAVFGDGSFAQYRCVKASDCMVLPDDASPAEGAAAIVNPLTALCMVETLRRRGCDALVHTAAASTLGRMLLELCREEGLALVNVVRRPEQVQELKGLGAVHVCDSSAPGFRESLTDAIAATGATVCFDAVGGKLTGRILACLEAAASRSTAEYSRYGTTEPKHVYVYGALDRAPIEIGRGVGLTWSVSGWLLFNVMAALGRDRVEQLHERIRQGLRTTFASHFTSVISLADALRPEIVADYAERRTGAKYLIDPQLGFSR